MLLNILQCPGQSPSPGKNSVAPNVNSAEVDRDIEIKSNLTIARGEGGGDNGEKGFQELL